MTEPRPLPAEPGTVWTPAEHASGPLGRCALVTRTLGGTDTGETRWPLAYTYEGRGEDGMDQYLVEMLIPLGPGVTVNVDRLPALSGIRVAVHS